MRLGFYSTNHGLPWGASEELWSLAAARLLERGHDVAVAYRRWPETPPRLAALAAGGARTVWVEPPLGAAGADEVLRPAAAARAALVAGLARLGLRPLFGAFRPDLALVSASYHTDDLTATAALRRYRIPYVLVLQCADAGDWITRHRLRRFRAAWAGARRSFFVSEENRRIVETQLAMRVPEPAVVWNRLAFRPAAPLPWPDEAGGIRLACVGRLHPRSKGQDLVIEVLARPRWRNRPVTVELWGEDQDGRRGLVALARRLGVEGRVAFRGYSADPAAPWRSAHALVLPSRYEGVPLVTGEAMAAGRPVVVTPFGRNAELVREGETGFLAAAATADLLDEALERAWAARGRWRAMGEAAARRLRTLWPGDPICDLARTLEEMVRGGAAR